MNGFWIAVNRFGIIDYGNKICSRKGCDKLRFKMIVTKKALPKVTIFVFALVKTDGSGKVFAQGKIDVTFDDLSDNFVSKK